MDDSKNPQPRTRNSEPGTDLNHQGTKNTKAAEIFAGPHPEPGTRNYEPSALRWYVKERSVRRSLGAGGTLPPSPSWRWRFTRAALSGAGERVRRSLGGGGSALSITRIARPVFLKSSTIYQNYCYLIVSREGREAGEGEFRTKAQSFSHRWHGYLSVPQAVLNQFVAKKVNGCLYF